MTFEFITHRDFDSTPAQYVRYLRDTQRAAEATLTKPVQKWPRGSSHDISRAIISECAEAYEDIVLEFGLFDAHGRLADFAQ